MHLKMAINFFAMVASFCVSLSMAFTDPPICPNESTVEASRHSARNRRKEVSLDFFNDAGIDLSVFWVNFDGEEVLVCLSVLL